MADIIRTVPPLPQTERGCGVKLEADAAGERILYCNGNNVLWRNIDKLADGKGGETPEDTFCWKQHAKRTTCVSMSPNSQWVVSGDVTGAIRVWGAKGEHAMKNEYKLWSGAVKDVSFSGDSTRIVAAGDGNEVSAVAILADTGSKTGQVAGHTKAINSISFRSQRPFRIATGGEDMLVCFHEGPPFKFSKSHNEHTNFVNYVRYSPDGDWCVSAGSDSKLCLYEGKSGDLVKEFAKPEKITGSLWAVAWSPDSKRLATAGGDKMLRIWDREAAAQVCEVKVGEATLQDMQIGLCWAKAERVISVCLDGRILMWDIAADGAAKLATAVEGTQGPITCLARSSTGTLIHGSTDGCVALTPVEGATKMLSIGKGVQHTLTSSKGAEAWVVALDNCVHRVNMETGEACGKPVEVKEGAVGLTWLDAEETQALVVTGKQSFIGVSSKTEVPVFIRKDAVERRPTAVAGLPGKFVAVGLDKPDGSVGGIASNKYDILLYGSDIGEAGTGAVAPKFVLEGHTGEVCSIKFSPTGEHLASGDAGSKIIIWNLKAEPPAKMHEFSRHTARVVSIDWLTPSRFVSGSLDQNVVISDIDQPSWKLQLPEGHRGGVTALVACAEDTVASVGHDGFLQVQKLK